LFLPAKATVVLKKSKRGKKRAEPGITKRGMAKLDKTPKKKQKSKKIPEDCLQLKNPPEWEMLVPVKMGLDTLLFPLLQRQNTKIECQSLLSQHNQHLKIILS
jgi:hypothetical protein